MKIADLENRRNPTAGINDLLSGMVVVTLCLGTMIVCRLGYGNELPISDASLRDDVVGHVLHRVRLPLEHSDLKAALSVEVHMQRRNREMVVAMELVSEPIGQVGVTPWNGQDSTVGGVNREHPW